MKKLMALVMLTVLVGAQTSSAKPLDASGEITLRDGSNTVLISVGDRRNDRRSDRDRLRRLERAVRDLQYRVYELEGSGQRDILYTCKYKAFSKVFYGQASTIGTAERIAEEKCTREYHSMHCEMPEPCISE